MLYVGSQIVIWIVLAVALGFRHRMDGEEPSRDAGQAAQALLNRTRVVAEVMPVYRAASGPHRGYVGIIAGIRHHRVAHERRAEQDASRLRVPAASRRRRPEPRRSYPAIRPPIGGPERKSEPRKGPRGGDHAAQQLGRGEPLAHRGRARHSPTPCRRTSGPPVSRR